MRRKNGENICKENLTVFNNYIVGSVSTTTLKLLRIWCGIKQINNRDISIIYNGLKNKNYYYGR